MLFKDIPGLEPIKNSLLNGVNRGKVAHAQLFCGAVGSANMALALAYATYLNCEERGENDSCGNCSSCSKSNKLVHPDLHFIFPVTTSKSVVKDASSASYMKEWRSFILSNPYATVTDWGEYIKLENKQPLIAAEEARNIVKTVAMKAFEGTYKVLILWLPEFMNAAAGNGLLKTLEEPPDKTIFLLVTNNQETLLTTILSRTQKVIVRSFEEKEIFQLLEKKFSYSADQLTQAALIAGGNMNEALRLADEIVENHHEMFRMWMRNCYLKNIKENVKSCDAFQQLGREGQKILLNYGQNMMRECIIFNFTPQLTRLRADELKFVQGFCKFATQYMLEKISQLLNEATYHIERNANAKIVFWIHLYKYHFC